MNKQSSRRRFARIFRTFAADPTGVIRALPGEIKQRHGGHLRQDSVEEAWNQQLHGLLRADWPCDEGHLLDDLLTEVGATLAARGIGFGRSTYGYYSDGDGSLCRAAWCAALHTKPEVVIETGVAHGVTSRIVIEALNLSDRGHLWSIDLPHPFNRELHTQTGAAVIDACRPRWSYIEGSSRRRLPSVIDEVSTVQLFIHDSLHTARNTLFEMEQAARKMPSGGVMLVDDISTHTGFLTFARRHPEYRTIICPSADRAGEFGIAVKA